MSRIGAWNTLLPALTLSLLGACTAQAHTSILTRSYDNARTGSNTAETILTPTAIKARGLVKAFSLAPTGADRCIEAQPLYVPGLLMPDGHRHDVIYVFTMSNTVWAYDAATGAALWPQPASLKPPFLPAWNDAVDSYHINRSFGILSTPVIDLQAGLIYIVAWDTDDPAHQNRTIHLNAIRLTDGKTPPDKPAYKLDASVTNASGQTIELKQIQKQRAALLLTPLRSSPRQHLARTLYVAFTGAEAPPDDGNPMSALHGWVIAFDVDTWQPAGQWISTPNTFGGGIWQGSQGPAADAQGNIYVITGNGGYLRQNGQNHDIGIGTTEFPESFIKLKRLITPQGSRLQLLDWFIVFRDSPRRIWTQQEVAPFPEGYDYHDQDLGSAGPLLPPGTGLLLGAGKDGILYVLDRHHLGEAIGDLTRLKAPPAFFTYQPDTTIASYQGASASSPDQDYKPMLGVKTRHLHGSPLYLDTAEHGPLLFGWGENGQLRAFTLDAAGHTQLVAHGADLASADLAAPTSNTLGGMPGGMLSASANGHRNGIVWATAPLTGDANKHIVPGVVRAYDATDFSAAEKNPDGIPQLHKLWEATGFTYSKFCPPIVADGRLIVPTYDGRVDIYVLGPAQPSTSGTAQR
jgi:outer membrane protein assembly factor BamB